MITLCSGAPTWREAIAFFFGEYLPRHRGLRERTRESYETALHFLTDRPDVRAGGPHELGVPAVLAFLSDLEERRGNQAQTRNQRLAALRSFWKAMELWDPAHREAYQHLLQVPYKRCARRSPDFLELEELHRVFEAVDPRTPRGFRDLALFRYMYNTGSRISEVAEARLAWLNFDARPAEATILGKGGSCRVCPLWPSTSEMLRVYLRSERPAPRRGFEDALFLTRRGESFGRGGLWKMLGGYFRRAAETTASLRHKHITPHSVRHSTAVHLLQAGVDQNVIKAWLGHADVSTTSVYLDLGVDKKREALERFLKLDLDRVTQGVKDASVPLPEHLVSWLERL